MRFGPALRAAVAAFAVWVCLTPAASAQRLKDLVDVEGVRANQLVGYGLVVGLNGTGDRLRNAPFTQQSLQGMLERLGTSVRDLDLRTRNVAAVMVSASLPAFARQGGTIDVSVSSLGDATSLSGGTLIVTPLLGADGQVYAVAQGPLVVGGFTAAGQAASLTQGVPTTARIANGAIVEREVGFDFGSMDSVKLALRTPDFTTAKRIEAAINRRIGAGAARMIDPATVQVVPPGSRRGDVAGLMAEIELLPIQPDTPARVVVDERSGTVVIGENVRISRVAVSQGGLTIQVTETPQVSQPPPFARQGQTVVVPRTDIQAEEGGGGFAVLNGPVTLRELVAGLNALGVKPRDMISILQAIKAAGALHADLEVI
ncbi:flagellar basal body P-ring protein FlgI [Inquilinus limosus]|uniref:flagellar basal body P-ring protein FlgI n=1 Tax=Inquilinus limosus TaxID=171674 RepID=UPI0003F95A1B|nr:flagellar basal body P-ring protein FlgI [Inquilinus limosus]